MSITRPDGRAPLDLRPVTIECDPVPHAEGSCLLTQGRTRVLVTASVEERVPPFLRDSGLGWVTAEYGMLPRATRDRSPREAARGKQDGRTVEIQRLIGRALRGVADRAQFPDRTVTIDCDVLIADAGTRCASITGAFVALALAFGKLERSGAPKSPLREALAAVSVGLSRRGGESAILLDLDYDEDSTADVDLNLVGTTNGRFVELQGTAEREPFGDAELQAMLAAGKDGLARLFRAQRAALEGRVPEAWLAALFKR
jgi:ribonuclease PH